MFGQNAPLVPRNGQVLIVGIVARISGCANQKEASLEDQIDHGKEVAQELYDGPIVFRIFQSKGKGESLDRPELAVIEQAYRSRELDLMIIEDLGRLVRGAEASRLLGIGKDHHTRTVVPNDCLDTDDNNWEEDVMEACAAHVGHNAHTSKRLKHKLMNRFKKHGGATAMPIYGYIIPPGAKTYFEWQKDEAATAIIREGARLLKESLNCSVVADFFNKMKVPVRKYKRSRDNWNGKKIRQYYRNSLLKGQPSRGSKFTEKHNETGRRRAVKNPQGPVFIECPHLAHLDVVEFDELNDLLAKENAARVRRKVNGVDPLAGRCRKDTRYPGHSAKCFYCGRPMVWGGNGVTGHLMCSGARDWQCWNSMGFDGDLAVTRIREAIVEVLKGLPDFEAQWQQLLKAACSAAPAEHAVRWQNLEKAEAELTRAKKNLGDAIASVGPEQFLKDKFHELDKQQRVLAMERRELERWQVNPDMGIAASITQIGDLINEQFNQLAGDSTQFGHLLRKLVPEFHVYLVRLCDGGHLLPRAKVKFALDGIVESAQHVPGLSELLTFERTLDLFTPPQRERIRLQAVQLAAEGLGPKAIVGRITEKPTATAVQNALALNTKMRELGCESPYVLLREPPKDYSKLRRHKNSKFRFWPLDGYQPPSL